jgi:integrase
MLRADRAGAYLSMSTSQFLKMVADGELPPPIGWTIERYLGHRQFAGLKPKTRENYRRSLDDLKRRVGGAMLADVTPRGIRVLRDQIAGELSTSFADMAARMVSLLWKFGGEFCDLDLGASPALGIAKVHVGSDGHQPWPQHVLDRFPDGAEPMLRLAFLLLLFSGQRIGDVARMKWEHFDGERISVRQEKTGERLWVPADGQLLAALKAAQRYGNGYMLNAARGKPISKDWLYRRIKARLDEIGALECVPHGLRKNAACALIEAGCSDYEAMAITGHRDLKTFQIYTRAVRNYRLAESAIEKRRLAAEAEAAKVVVLRALAKPGREAA